MNLNELAKEAHQIAVDHGWWSPEPSFGDLVALMHSELSEALEEYRAGNPNVWYACMQDGLPCDKETCEAYGKGHCSGLEVEEKPEGIAVELADCIIRILDWAGKEGVDMESIIKEKMAYNRTRPYRHGGKLL